MFKKQLLVPLIIFFIILVLAIVNYSSGSFLTGWDNLHPEFNFLVNIKRSIFSVWQEYQGLGLLGGMGHASDLFRQVFLGISSLVLPANLLRYFYHLLMLLVGSLGVYILMKNIVLAGASEKLKGIGGLLGGIFYLFNMAMVQMFYVPFEPYSSHFGLLPWLIYANLNFLFNNKKKNLLLLFLINILAVSQGYVATFFLVTFISLSLIFLTSLILKMAGWKKILVAYLILFSVNAFWLLPNLYFLVRSTDVTVNAKINQMSTEDNFLRNKKYGNLQNTILLKGFWFDNVEIDKEGIPRYQFENWRIHFDQPWVPVTGYFLFGVIVLGIIVSLKDRFKRGFIFIPLFLFSFTILTNDTPPFSFFASLFYRLPLFGQIFRFTFTKFSIITAFSYAIFFSLGSLYLLSLIRKKFLNILILFLLISLPVVYLYPVFQGNLFYSKNRSQIPPEYFQVFEFFKKQPKGERIANFPQYTFWGWTFYNWNYSGSGFLWYGIEQSILDRAFDVWSPYDENYYWEISEAVYSQNPSLFQKVLEKYQVSWLLIDDNVISYANNRSLYLPQLEEIIKQTTNTSLFASFGKIRIYRVELATKSKDFIFLAFDLPQIGPEYKWNNYDKGYEEYGNYISQAGSVKREAESETNYPFRSLFTGRKQEELEYNIKDSTDYYIFSAKIPTDFTGGKLVISPLIKEEMMEYDPADLSKTITKFPEIFIDGELVQTNLSSDFSTSEESLRNTSEVSLTLPYLRDGNLEVRVPKINDFYSYNSQPTTYNLQPKSCDQFNTGDISSESISENGKDYLRLTSLRSSNCLDFDLPNLTQKLGYLVTVENRNIEGKSLLFSVINKNSQRSDIETYLPKRLSDSSTPGESLPAGEAGLRATPGVSLTPSDISYFIVPPMEEFGRGYTLHLDNISIGRVKTVNDLGKITVNPIPYRFLTGMRIIKNQITDNLSAQAGREQKTDYKYEVLHPNPSYYQVSLSDSSTPGESMPAGEAGLRAAPGVSLSHTENMTLVLSQSFDEGWHAYRIKNSESRIKNFLNSTFPFIFGEEIKDHVLVNNWENGWKISNLSLANSRLQNNDQKTNDQSPTTTIIVFYLPQLLEYLGFGFLGIGFLYLLLTKHPKSS